MPDQLTSALLIVVAIAYLGGAVLLIVALAKVLLAWSVSWRASGQTSPVDVVLQQRAAAAIAAVAAVANVPPPATDVVAILGAPVAGEADGTVGDGGLAVTRFRAGRPPTVVFARAALTGFSAGAVQSLAAHELGHVIRRERSSAAARYSWLVGYLLLVLAGAGLTAAAFAASPQLAGPSLPATMSAAVVFLGLRFTFDRREEAAADLFAIDLTRDLDAAAELMRFNEKGLARPTPDGGPAWSRLERRWFATHPEPQARLAAMRRRLG